MLQSNFKTALKISQLNGLKKAQFYRWDTIFYKNRK